MWQGPNHPGITGNMSLRLVIEGDSVVDCETHVGYLHRGFEKLMERRLWMQNFPLVCRIAVPEPDFNEYCYAAALEELAGIEVPDKAVWLRTLSLEMIRLASFLMWIGGQAGAFGHGTIAQWSVTMRDYVLDLFEELTGGRIYHMYIIPGGVRGDVPAGFLRRVLETMDTVRKNLDDIELVMFHNVVYKMRAQGLGYIPPDWVDQYGITGPNARAAGLPRDLRKDLGYLAYPRLSFEPIVGTVSDAFERSRLRLLEMYQSIDLIRQIVDMLPARGAFRAKLPNPLHWKIPAGETYVAAECTRGEYGFYVVSDGGDKPRRVAVRGPSYTHGVALMERLARGVNIADVAGLMVSLHTYPPEIER
ncbi:MAG: NADH-quinone oxidoreductase subunit D [Spirochaetes bacterium GWD1_61_31]|nr:MAG: NADH-quinone oxidoreductase subunit D [Spirochaetes bacterium GWB1_60_80]OHD41594.1 MAG: NADH-quinone oxidoreductase subunit D [Spirochaetes bacterium GWE1_60_18]OHD44331.1 MAG: NADH-quinone oxidoreductase subunit D [Spirochaetes bacterium GWD1_61_31]OHD61498.1 MAG: NADH-quinone oxidoreductase subunit D [Spirochaetes bacterium GWF1_60_12]